MERAILWIALMVESCMFQAVKQILELYMVL